VPARSFVTKSSLPSALVKTLEAQAHGNEAGNGRGVAREHRRGTAPLFNYEWEPSAYADLRFN